MSCNRKCNPELVHVGSIGDIPSLKIQKPRFISSEGCGEFGSMEPASGNKNGVGKQSGSSSKFEPSVALGIYLGEMKMVVHTTIFVADIHSSINHDSQTADITQISILS